MERVSARGALVLGAALAAGLAGALAGCNDEKRVPPGEENDGGPGRRRGGAPGGGDDGGREDGGREDGGREDGGGSSAEGGSGGVPDRGAGSDAREDAGVTMGGSGGTGGASEDTCVPTGEQMFERLGAGHVPAPIDASEYNSRPPSSGMHCDAWARWGSEFTAASPLPACNFLHNLEHGAVVLLYNCPAGCPELVQLLRDVVNEPSLLDPDCSGQGIKRLLITPYADMEAKIAATTWGYTWTSDCIDGDTKDELIAFINAHWGSRAADKAPEPTICGHGSIAP